MKTLDQIEPEKEMVHEKFAIFVKEKANYKCEICGSKLSLEAHHKTFSFEGGKNTLNNGICLCRKCHKKIHGASDANKYKYLHIRLPIDMLQKLRNIVYANKSNKKLISMNYLAIKALQEFLEKHFQNIT